jgi:hypothetical protein
MRHVAMMDGMPWDDRRAGQCDTTRTEGHEQAPDGELRANSTTREEPAPASGATGARSSHTHTRTGGAHPAATYARTRAHMPGARMRSSPRPRRGATAQHLLYEGGHRRQHDGQPS